MGSDHILRHTHRLRHRRIHRWGNRPSLWRGSRPLQCETPRVIRENHPRPAQVTGGWKQPVTATPANDGVTSPAALTAAGGRLRYVFHASTAKDRRRGSKSFLILDRKRAGEHLAEWDDGLGAKHTHRLELVVDEMEEVFVVTGIQLDKHVILAGGEMHFGHFRNGVELLDDFVKRRGFLEIDSDKSTCVISQGGGLDESARTFKDIGCLQLGDTLMNRRTADATLAGDFEERLPSVVYQHLEYFGVQLVNL